MTDMTDERDVRALLTALGEAALAVQSLGTALGAAVSIAMRALDTSDVGPTADVTNDGEPAGPGDVANGAHGAHQAPVAFRGERNIHVMGESAPVTD